MTTVRATCFADCPFSAAVEFAEETLRQRPDVTLSPAEPISHQVHVKAQLAEDVSDDVRRHDALLLAWKPKYTKLLPGFHGALTVRPKGHGVSLRIQGSYEPPLGAFGRLFDRLFGRAIARRTLARLLSDISGSAERRWHAFRNNKGGKA